MTAAGGWSQEPPDDPRVEAMVHLQRAALEFIAAARAVLDLAEDVVRAPGGLAAVVAETAGSFAAAAGGWRAPRGRAGGVDGEGMPDGSGRGRVEDVGDAEPAGVGDDPVSHASRLDPDARPGAGRRANHGVQHIRIS